METHFVSIGSSLYKEACQLRKELFFKDLENAELLLNDNYEKNSMHLVIESKGAVIGTGRLTITDNNTIGIISQMAIDPDFQRLGLGKFILQSLLKRGRELNVNRITLNARLTAITFYAKNEFIPIGEVFASTKTGVLHQQMELQLG
ncbi:GNAT family N-acetyltransferase [Aquimarina agarilytica]|uniref:GNAT family N-acetyltransferase n=1 Tax=Aquimarina agarilytica TaxID=1087449 RepID=UPI000288B137|nr:GNAT family N-acetyltransferase [Aquimarina agarilytica]